MKSCIECSLKSKTHDEQQGEFVFCFDSGEDTFKGHFPDYPILPGVFQLEMVRFCCEQITETRLNITRIVRASFTRPILPEEDILVTVELESDNKTVYAKSILTVSGEKAGKCSMDLCSVPKA